MLVGNMASAIYVLTIKKGGKNESATALAFYPELMTVIICLGIITITNDWPRDPKGLLYIAIAGAFNGIATLLYIAAYRRTHKNALIAPFHYTQIIAGSLIGYAVWNDVPTKNLIVGVIIIIAAGLYVIRHGANQPELPEKTGAVP
jgi:drug/metabolite transporter (DMT)-like permease